MADADWTLDPQINASMETLEMPQQSVIDRWNAERAPIEAAAPKVGDAAPDFSAERLSGLGKPTGQFVHLDDFRQRYLALLFGNITCPIYRGQIRRCNEIYDEFRGRLAFLLIYVREEHPVEGWRLPINDEQGIVYEQPVTLEQRVNLASTCIRRYGIDMPVAVDDMDNSIERRYAGAPERLYLIDPDGVVVHRSVSGPFKLSAIDDWHRALQAVV